MIYIDSPGTTAPVTYSARGGKLTEDDGDLSLGNNIMRGVVAISFPGDLITSVTQTDTITITSIEWTEIGLTVTATPFDAGDPIAILVNLNYHPLNANAVGMFTIFANDVDLGASDDKAIHYLRSNALGEGLAASMSYMYQTTSTEPIEFKVKCRIGAQSFEVSHGGQTRLLAAIIPPAGPPTVNPTLAPTIQPSHAPTVILTAAPSATPTAPTLDCTSGCVFPEEYMVSGRLLARNINLPDAFSLQFKVKITRLANDWHEWQENPLNFIELVDRATSNSLLALQLRQIDMPGVFYNGVQL